MAEDLGDYLHGDAAQECEGGVSVPEVVEVYWGYAGAVAGGFEVGLLIAYVATDSRHPKPLSCSHPPIIDGEA